MHSNHTHTIQFQTKQRKIVFIIHEYAKITYNFFANISNPILLALSHRNKNNVS